MHQFKTQRCQDHVQCSTNLNHTLYGIATDYFCALEHPDWAAQENTDAEGFHHDLMILLKQWCDREESRRYKLHEIRLAKGWPL